MCSGISSFADHPEDLPTYLQPLLDHARKFIPPSLHAETPLFLLATAGMRLLSSESQATVLRETCHFIGLQSNFLLDSPSEEGPCGSSVRIITGEEEGLFGWIAVNYLMDGFTANSGQRTTYGFLDMGGASTQIAFEPSADHEKDSNLIDVRLRLLNGKEITHKVFVTTWLGYGTNRARERYVEQAVEGSHSSAENNIVYDPCLPKHLELSEKAHSSDALDINHRLVGTGSFEQCLRNTSTLLNTNVPCPNSPCLMNGVHVPPIDFSVSHFIGVSEYWYSSDHVFGLGGAYDFVQYEQAASKFCSQEWDSIVKKYEDASASGKWTDRVGVSRLQLQCFKAAWIVNILHEGLGMPRLLDSGGTPPTQGDKVEEQAENKGLGRPTFQSVDTVGDIAISWTLGKMVLEASSQVPRASLEDRPLHDPLSEVNDPNFPIKPIRPFYDLGYLEDQLTPHLPSSLTRASLGFSPILLLSCITFICMFIFIISPCRRIARSSFVRVIRTVTRKASENAYELEEGLISRQHRSTSSTWFKPVQRLLSWSGLAHSPTRPPATTGIPSSQTSLSPPNYIPEGISTSRSASPSPGAMDDPPLYSFTSRSRNASQSSLVPRYGISRSNSYSQLGTE
jgi:golgi apyrase